VKYHTDGGFLSLYSVADQCETTIRHQKDILPVCYFAFSVKHPASTCQWSWRHCWLLACTNVVVSRRMLKLWITNFTNVLSRRTYWTWTWTASDEVVLTTSLVYAGVILPGWHTHDDDILQWVHFTPGNIYIEHTCHAFRERAMSFLSINQSINQSII